MMQLGALRLMSREHGDDIRGLGGIPILLSFLSPNAARGTPASDQVAVKRHRCLAHDRQFLADEKIAIQAEVCAALAHLAHADLNALHICENNGIYLVASLLLPQPDRQPADRGVHKLQLNAMRTLRFLFAQPQNRRPFKRLFPPEIFEAFLRAKHYNYDISAYEPAVAALSDLVGRGPGGIGAFVKAIAATDAHAAPSRRVRDYALLECLGEGAFGSVYRARRNNSNDVCAVKELVLGGSCSADELRANLTSIEHEVFTPSNPVFFS